MLLLRKTSQVLAVIACATGSEALANAAPTQVTIPGQTMPWAYSAKLNKRMPFGNDDGTASIAVTLASLGAAPGQKSRIKYVSGTICPGGSYACVDARGNFNFITDHDTGNSGKYFPSFYIAKEPTYLCELVGVHTDATGKIVGRAFVIPDVASKAIPAGATQLQLGVNDDLFSDNSGSWILAVDVK